MGVQVGLVDVPDVDQAVEAFGEGALVVDAERVAGVQGPLR
jgi:hypothetical protein